jgi:hypothetical protein
MMFWDSSAIVPLIVAEPSTSWARNLLKSDPRGIVWMLSRVEVRSALARRNREGALKVDAYREAIQRTQDIFDGLSRVTAWGRVTDRAIRLLDLHAVRSADAMQLASALVTARENPAQLPFVTLDLRLAEAAEKEGFAVRRFD